MYVAAVVTPVATDDAKLPRISVAGALNLG